MITFVRTAFPFRAQPQFGRATGMATSISCLRQSPRARCLTFTLPPNGGGPGCCSGLRTPRSQPFHYPRARFHAPSRSNAIRPGHTLGCSTFARGSGIKNVSRYRGTIVERLVASLLATANRHCVLVRLFDHRGREASPRPGLQQYHAQADSVGVPEPGVTEQTLALRLPDAGASPSAHFAPSIRTVPPAPDD